MPIARSQSLSLVLHVVTLALLLLLTSRSFLTPPPLSIPNLTRAVPLAAPPPIHTRTLEREGGGSNTSPSPARKGVAPPRAARTFIPPVLQPDPKLPVSPTIDFDVPVINVSGHFGDPLSNVPGYGIGDEGGHGIGRFPGGPGIGDKSGIKASGRLGAPIKPAELIYRVDPEFSEDARKAKFQGMVVLMIEIGADGRPHNPQIVADPGLGLSEKAIEAVSQWRFRPAQRSGTPIVTTARVEVHFHLM